MSNVYVHFSEISFPTRYSVVNFQLESLSLRFREVIRILNRKTAAHGSWRIHERLVITYASYRLTLFAFRVKHISLLRERFALVGQYPRASPYFNSCSHEGSDHFLFLFR